MPKSNVALPPGAVEETVTQRRMVSEVDAHKNQFSGMEFWDVMDASGDAEEWRRQAYSCYVNRGFRRSAYLVKFFEWHGLEHLRDKEEILFDGKVAQRGIGGGEFHFMFKKGSECIAEGNFEIEGPERKLGQAAPAAVSSESDIVRIVQMLREQGGNGVNDGALMKVAMVNALEIQKAAIMQNQMGPQQMMEIIARMRGSGETPEWAKQLFAALIPVGVTLLTKILEPKDMVGTIKGMSEAITAMRGLSNEPAQPDLTTSIFNNLAPLGNAVSSVLAQLNQAAQIAAQNRMLAAAGEKAQQSVQQPGAPAMPRAQQPPQAAPADPKQFTPEQVWTKMVEMCHQDAGGAFAFDFLLQIDADTMRRLRQANISFEQLEEVVRTGAFHPLTKQMASSPHYQKFLREFYDALMAMPMPGAPPAPQPIN